MKLNCEKGDLCRVITPGPFQDKLIVVKDRCDGSHGPEWTYEGEMLKTARGWQRSFFDRVLRPIRAQPGNEDFVVKARKSLPRKKPVTGPVTIDARGEVVR